MKRIFLLLSIMAYWSAGMAQYKPADQGSTVKFTIQNFGFDVTGSFEGMHGTIDFNPEKPADAHFDVDIDAATINTDNNLRDEHLRGENYFDVKKYPKIRLQSVKIEVGSKPGSWLLEGKLTIKNNTKDISFPFTATPIADGYRFSGTFKIKRKDFGIGGTSTISDELEVHLNIIAKK